MLPAGARIRLGQSELVVHEGRATASSATDPRGADVYERPSAGVRDLGRAAQRSYPPRR